MFKLNPKNRKFTRKSAALAAVASIALLTTACANNSGEEETAQSDKFVIWATTGYLADAAKNIAPEADIHTLVGPGGDPHTYQPTTKDIQALSEADLVLWNGLHLEAQMDDQLESLGDKQLAVGDVLHENNAALLPWEEEGEEDADLHDPHIWNDPKLWGQVVTSIGDKLAELDSANAKTYTENAKTYNEEIADADTKAQELLSKVPAPRTLISGHDAFNYFGRTYDLEVHATDFISTEAALSATQINELAELIASKKVPAIFLDNQANPQAIKSLAEAVKAKGWEVKIADTELYADTLGADEAVDTYIEVLLHNAQAVTDALS